MQSEVRKIFLPCSTEKISNQDHWSAYYTNKYMDIYP